LRVGGRCGGLDLPLGFLYFALASISSVKTVTHHGIRLTSAITKISPEPTLHTRIILPIHQLLKLLLYQALTTEGVAPDQAIRMHKQATLTLTSSLLSFLNSIQAPNTIIIKMNIINNVVRIALLARVKG
jgi:hypothetical protein